MTTKLDIPKNKGALTYSNNGSCSRVVNYQISNKEKLGDDNSFFTLTKDQINPEEAKSLIDNNVKGLRSGDEKFYSFSINPSNEELEFINNDKSKIKEYTRAVMSNYAETFKEKGLKNENLVWTAIIHDTRYYTHEDITKAKEEKVAINFKVGEKKPGNNIHIHVIVSRNSSDMKKMLTIRGRKGKDNFSLFEFQKKNQDTFQTLIKYKVGVNLYGEMQTKSLLKSIHKLSTKMPLSDNEVLKIAKKHNYSGQINFNLKDLVKSVDRGEVINDPYKFIEVGKKQYNKDIKNKDLTKQGIVKDLADVSDTFLSILTNSNSNEKNKGEVPDISDYSRKRKKKRKFII